jgi:DNA-binding LytR/AlgR family response regulator
MKLTCMIIDDEPIARMVVEEFIRDIDYLELTGVAENPVKAMALLKKQSVDLLFLDINMPRMNGFEFLKCTSHLPLVVVTTAYAEYAVEGFELDVLDYLLKPISFERFKLACEKARKHLQLVIPQNENLNNQEDHFFVKNNNSIEKICYEDLNYVEALLNYVVLHTSTRKLMVYMTIKSIIDQLPQEQFIKVHKSYIVNTKKIKSIEGNIIDIGNAKISISQNLREEVLKKVVKNKLLKRS